MTHKIYTLRTYCGRELWAGFFGIDEVGNQPECTTDVEIEVEEDCLEIDEYGIIQPSFVEECPGCGGDLEWPQEWEIVNIREENDE